MGDIAQLLSIDASPARYAAVVIATLVAGLTDAIWLKISNAVTLPLIAVGVLFHSLFAAGQGVLFAASGVLVGFTVLFVLFAAGGVGAGDVKLMAGIGAWVGPHDVLVLFAVAGLMMGFYSLALLARTVGWRRLPGHLVSRSSSRETVEQVAEHPDGRRRLVPMGVVIALAVAFLLLRDYLQSTKVGV